MVTATAPVAAPVTSRQTFWDTVGKPVEGQTGRDFLASVDADWTVAKHPLFAYGAGDKSALLLPVPGRMAMVRQDTSSVIATVGETYHVIQNYELGDLADALLEVEEGTEFIKGGALNGGRIVYLVAKLPDGTFRVEGDDSPIEKFLILRTGHDGLTSLTLGPTAVRLWCENQVNMTIRGLKSKIVIRHTSNAAPRVEAMRKALNFTGEYFDGLARVSQQLVDRPFTYKDLEKLTVKLIPSMAEDEEKAVKAQAQRDLILGIAQNADNLQNLAWTSYRAYQAIVQYADHERTYRKTKKGSAADARAVAILDGTALGIKDRAMDLLLPTVKRDKDGHFVKA